MSPTNCVSHEANKSGEVLDNFVRAVDGSSYGGPVADRLRSLGWSMHDLLTRALDAGYGVTDEELTHYLGEGTDAPEAIEASNVMQMMGARSLGTVVSLDPETVLVAA